MDTCSKVMQIKCKEMDTPAWTHASQTRGLKVLAAIALNIHLSKDQFCLKIWGHVILISKQKQRCYRVECKIDKMSLKVGLEKKLHIVGGAFWTVLF